jgi:hypothetical protein
MRLQKQVSRRIEEVEYAKYVVVIPPDNVERLGWKEGEELDSQIQGQKLVLFPRSNGKEKGNQK